MRAISTVLDVAVFLLLVSAAVATVAYAPAQERPDVSSGETAAVLATTTATVEYDLRGDRRESHGTLAALLGRATVANATLDGVSVAPFTGDFVATVGEEVRSVLSAPNRTQISAQWTPYPGAPVRSRVVVGPSPPPGVDVAASTLTVPGPVRAVDTAELERAPGGYRPVARAVATAVTETLLPTTRFDASLGRASPTRRSSVSRFRTVGLTLDVSVRPELAAGNVSAAHGTVTRALAGVLAESLASEFASPSEAHDAVRTGVVRVTVRRWEP